MKPLEAVGSLAAAFQKELKPETLAVYVDALADIDPALLAAAVKHCIAGSRFFPTISELRMAAARIAGLLPPSSAEVVALIRQADVREAKFRRDGSYAYTERYWRWPEGAAPAVVTLCQTVIAKAGEPCDEEGKDIFGWDTAARKVYEADLPGYEAAALSSLSTARLLPAHDAARLPA